MFTLGQFHKLTILPKGTDQAGKNHNYTSHTAEIWSYQEERLGQNAALPKHVCCINHNHCFSKAILHLSLCIDTNLTKLQLALIWTNITRAILEQM